MAAKLLVLALFAAAVMLVGASRNMEVLNAIQETADGKMNKDLMTVIQEAPASGRLGDTYCCLKNGWGSCVQECDSNINYYCCLETRVGNCWQLCDETKEYFCCLEYLVSGCKQQCEKGHEYYCCKTNGSGKCVGMCPESATVSLEQVTGYKN